MAEKYLIANWKMNMNSNQIDIFKDKFIEEWRTYQEGSYVNETYIDPIVVETEKKPTNFPLTIVFCPSSLFLYKLLGFIK